MRFACIGAVCLLPVLSGCAWFDSQQLWRSDNYVIQWIDSPDTVRLSYSMGGGSGLVLVPPCVYAVAEDKAHIVVMRRRFNPALNDQVVVIDKINAGA